MFNQFQSNLIIIIKKQSFSFIYASNSLSDFIHIRRGGGSHVATPTMNNYPRASATLAIPWRVRYFRKIIKARAATKAPTKKYSVTA